MATASGSGFSKEATSFKAGEQAAQVAAKSLKGKADLAIVYATPKHDPKELISGVRSVVGSNAKIVGGPAFGVITEKELGYSGFEVGVFLLQSDTVKVKVVGIDGMGKGNEFELGQQFGEKLLKEGVQECKGMLLMYDAIRPDPKQPLNLALPILQGIESKINKWPPAAGMGLMGNMQGLAQQQWLDDKIMTQAIYAVLFFGPVTMENMIFHGCKPSSDYLTITKAHGQAVLEIDGKPAITRVLELLGPSSKLTADNFPLFLLMGYNEGDKYSDFDPEKYANRLCLTVDKASGAIILFEPDLKTGDQVQLMQTSMKLDYMRQEADKFIKRLDSKKKPIFASYIDCVGRAAAFSKTETEDAIEIQKTIGGRMPLLGCYSGVEIASVGGRVRPLDWTGVLSVFSVVE